MTIEELVRERLPHAPQMGLYVVPDLPDKQLRNALSDYATDVDRAEVLALYDATLSGTGGDGAVFTADHFLFQNNDFQSAQRVRYQDLVGVEAHSRWFGLGGKRVSLEVNRGRATFDLTMDFSGAPEAAEYVADFLHAATLQGVELGRDAPGAPAETDIDAVRRALDRLRSEQKLTDADFERLIGVLTEGGGPDEGA
jgi:hypothetical protein